MNVISFPVEGLQAHPLSLEIFGDLVGDDFDDLVKDIAERGLQYPLELDIYHRVICGSQRLRAIQKLKWNEVQVIIREYQDENEIRKALLKDNLLRRQLVPAQIYKAARELERIYAIQAAERQQAGTLAPKDTKGKAAAHAVRDIGVSETTYQRLKTVYEKGSQEIQDQVDQGKLSISGAAKKIKASESPRRTKKLAPDDTRAAALNWARFDREVEKWEKFLRANPPGKYGHYEGDVRSRVEKLKARIEAYLALKTGEKAA